MLLTCSSIFEIVLWSHVRSPHDKHTCVNVVQGLFEEEFFFYMHTSLLLLPQHSVEFNIYSRGWFEWQMGGLNLSVPSPLRSLPSWKTRCSRSGGRKSTQVAERSLGRSVYWRCYPGNQSSRSRSLLPLRPYCYKHSVVFPLEAKTTARRLR